MIKRLSSAGNQLPLHVTTPPPPPPREQCAGSNDPLTVSPLLSPPPASAYERGFAVPLPPPFFFPLLFRWRYKTLLRCSPPSDLAWFLNDAWRKEIRPFSQKNLLKIVQNKRFFYNFNFLSKARVHSTFGISVVASLPPHAHVFLLPPSFSSLCASLYARCR